ESEESFPLPQHLPGGHSRRVRWYVRPEQSATTAPLRWFQDRFRSAEQLRSAATRTDEARRLPQRLPEGKRPSTQFSWASDERVRGSSPPPRPALPDRSNTETVRHRGLRL